MSINKAIIEKVTYETGSSIVAVEYTNAYFAAPLHKHPQFELILFEEGDGHRFIGDHVAPISAGDFILLPPNMSHLWLSSDVYYDEENTKVSRSVYAQFGENIFPKHMSDIVELDHVHGLLKNCSRGLIFSGEGIEDCKLIFRKLPGRKAIDRWLTLYALLDRLACLHYEPLASKEFAVSNEGSGNKIVDSVHAYLNANYNRQVNLEDIAATVYMNPSSLCRYYKGHTGQTIFAYLSELRINYAMKLLSNSNRNIAGIAYECGYNSLSHFNHQFRRITGYTPSVFVRMFM